MDDGAGGKKKRKKKIEKKNFCSLAVVYVSYLAFFVSFLANVEVYSK